MYTKLLPQNLYGTDVLKDLGVDEKILKWIQNKYGTSARAEFKQLRPVSSDGTLRTH
jgi:hypothetical protein